MSNQLDIFQEQSKKDYEAHYHSFYRGVKERYAKKNKKVVNYVCINISSPVSEEEFMNKLFNIIPKH